MRFKEWFLKEDATLGTELVVDQISSDYAKAKYAIDLVRAYDATKPDKEGNVLEKRKLLINIGTIAKLSAGPKVFGLFKPEEDHQMVVGPQNNVNQINQFFKGKLSLAPESLVKKYFPNLAPTSIMQSSIIRVNVPKIVQVFGDSPKAVLEIAKTIVHEATHQLERQITGDTKDGPNTAVERAEAEFENWALKGAGKDMFSRMMNQVFPGQKI
jgi:hypothetical protein